MNFLTLQQRPVKLPPAHFATPIAALPEEALARLMAEQARREGHRRAFPVSMERHAQHDIDRRSDDCKAILAHLDGEGTVGTIGRALGLKLDRTKRLLRELERQGRVQTHLYGRHLMWSRAAPVDADTAAISREGEA